VKVSVIVKTFEQPDYLGRVLKAISGQVVLPDEVLVADDGSGEDTKAVFEKWAKEQSFRAVHVWHERNGSRRSQILNKSIVQAQGDYIIFLDGDTVPHPEFVSDHEKVARAGFFVQGHRALVARPAVVFFGLGEFGRDRSRALWSFQLSGNAFRWPFPVVTSRSDLKGIRGCNFAMWREDLLAVNGFNEAFVGWGREDSEVVVRLMNHSVKRRDVRGWALCFHLWHPPASRNQLTENDRLLAETIESKATRCELGVSQYLS